MSKQLKVGILGAGAIAAIHLDAFAQYPQLCRVTAVCDLYAEKAAKLIQEKGLQAEAYSSQEEMLKKADVDIVSICLPPAMHCEATVLALQAGKHVLCEKPMASSLEECDRMILAAAQSGKLLSIVCQNRFKTPMRKVKTLIRQETAGRVLFATVHSLWWRGANYYDIWWRGTWEKEGGGCLVNHAVHHLDLLQWMIGMPKRVTAVISNVAHDNSECEDVGMALLEYGDKVAQVTSSLVSHGEEQTMIFQCERARLSIPWKPAAEKALPNGFPEADEATLKEIQAAYDALPKMEVQNHPAQVRHFLRAIRGEEKLEVDGAEGRKTMELVMAIYRSAATGQPVELPLSPEDAFYCKESMNASMPRFNKKTRSVENFETEKITLGRDVGQ